MTGRPAPRPKRGGAARSHYSNDENASKKVCFDTRNPSALAADALEDDAVLDADEIGKRGQQTKRNAVNIDGYESDSSNEGFNARADARAKETKNGGGKGVSEAEDDNDMFADLEEEQFPDGDANAEEEHDTEGKKKKSVRFVDVDDIEGQVGASRSGGHVRAPLVQDADAGQTSDVESSSDSEVGDERRAELDDDMDEELGAGGKKKHAPKLDAFNLKAEKEDGGFDEQLNYVRKAVDPDAIHDSWLQGVSKKDMKRAREAHEKRNRDLRQREREDDSVLTADILRGLIPHLERGETVLEALARLGRGAERKKRKTKKPKWQSRNKGGQQDMDVEDEEATAAASEDPAETKRRRAVEAITDAAERLMARGQDDVYDEEREVLMRQYGRETGEEWIEPPVEGAEGDGEKSWEYRWSDARDGGDIHGPYDGATMQSWNGAGYFGEGVEFRRAGDGGGEWNRSVEFM